MRSVAAVRRIAARFSEKRRLRGVLQHRPRQVLVFPVGSGIGLAASSLAREMGVPSYSFVSVTVAGHARSISIWDVDNILTYGSQAVEAFTDMGYAPECLTVVGNPAYDALVRSSRAARPAGHVPVILIATSRIDPSEDAWLEKVIEWVEGRKDLAVVVRPHPSIARSDYPFARRIDALPLRFSDNARSVEDVMEASAVITDYSTVGAEALIANRPLMVVNMTGHEYPSNRYDEMGLALRASRIDQIAECLERLIGSPPPSETNPEAYARFTSAYNGPNDGDAARRILEHVVMRR
jgi:UDP-N-acetylglucosamine 2-epimerase